MVYQVIVTLADDAAQSDAQEIVRELSDEGHAEVVADVYWRQS